MEKAPQILMPFQFGEAELVEKRSRFIGQVWPITCEGDARQWIADTKATYHDARHHCWCYCIKEDISSQVVTRYSDDGEPQGSAGQPMLEVFSRGGVDNYLCVVTRYFGGILLGTGGLSRAYAAAAKQALVAAGLSALRPLKSISIDCPYAMFDRIKKEIELCAGVVDNLDYGVNIMIQVSFREDDTDIFLARLIELSNGMLHGQVTGRRLVPMRLD